MCSYIKLLKTPLFLNCESSKKNAMEYCPPPPNHSILNPLTMAYRTPYPLYFDHPIHGIVKPSLIFNCESSKIAMEYRTLSHGILNPLLMAYRTPYIWYFETPTHDILTAPYPWNIKPPLVFKLLVKCNSMVY